MVTYFPQNLNTFAIGRCHNDGKPPSTADGMYEKAAALQRFFLFFLPNEPVIFIKRLGCLTAMFYLPSRSRYSGLTIESCCIWLKAP